MPSCGWGWTATEIDGLHDALVASFQETAPVPSNAHPQDHFADWLARWFDLHTGTFGRCRNELSHECAGMLAGDMHAAGFAVVRIDDLQTGVRISDWYNPSDDIYLDEVIAERQKMAEQQEYERERQ